MNSDLIDTLMTQWNRERPDLDPQPMAVVGRILRAAAILERRVNEALKPFGLAMWAFDVLVTLRRHGAPYSMTPGELTESTMLSSGAMTNRIDRLEGLGLVERSPAPNDRRSFQITLTEKGKAAADEAIAARFDEAADAVKGLSNRDQKQLSDLLRKLLNHLDS